MAKKSIRQSLSIESIVDLLYDNGVLHSIIFHTFILLVMALMFQSDKIQHHVRLSLSFSDTVDENFSTEKPTEISFAKHETLTEINQNNSQKVEEILASSVSDIKQITIEEVKHIDDTKEISDIDTVLELNPKDLDKEFITQKPIKQNVRHTSQRFALNTNQQDPNFNSQQNNNLFGVDSNSYGQNGTSGGAINDIDKRLKAAGAQTGDVQISIAWNTTDDIDLHVHVVSPDGQRSYISWMNRIGLCGGMLDVDMNANPTQLNRKPVENVFWRVGQAPHGEFIIGVHNFNNWSSSSSTNVMVVVRIEGKIQTYNVNVRYGKPLTEVVRFKR
jgi:hypothetical protein